jgi:hypothetical protein
MKNKVLYSAIAGAVGLLGCAGANMMAASPCTPGKCTVVVTVTDCTRRGGVSVDQDPVNVFQANNIDWEFATRGYKFPANGIVIGDDPEGQIGTPVVAPNGKKVTVHDKHTKVNYSIYYAVNVMTDAGIFCIPLDPLIANM